MKKSTLFFFLLITGLLAANLYITYRGSQATTVDEPQDMLDCRQQLKYANDLSTRKLYASAADAYADYADRCAKDTSDAAYTQLRLGDLYASAGDYEYALASYYKAETLDKKVKQHTGPKIVAALTKMNLSSEAKTEEESRVAVDEAAVSEKPKGKAVAKVGGETVYEDDVLSLLDELPPEMKKASQTPQIRQMLVKQYVVQSAIAQRAKRLGLDNDAQVKKASAMMEKQLLVKAVLEKEVAAKMKVSDEELRAAYEKEKAKFSMPTQIGLVFTESGDRAKAKDVLRKKENLVWIDDSFTYIPGLGEAEAAISEIMALEKGAVSDPFVVDGKKYVVMVKEKKEGSVKPFDEVKAALSAELLKEKQKDAMDAFVERVMKEEDVELYPEEKDTPTEK